MIYAQESIVDEIIVDNFAGGVCAGACKPAGVVRREHNDNGAVDGLCGGVKGGRNDAD